MKLLLADLRALANLPGTAAGRRTLAANACGLGLLAVMSHQFTDLLLDHPGLVVGLHRASGGESQRALFEHALTACPVVAAWLGLALAQRQLFEAPELPLWRLAPLPSWRPAMQALLRSGFLASLWALSIAGPAAAATLQRGPAPAWAYALVPLAVVGATVPALAALLATQLLLVRFLAGRWLRLVLVAVAALASVGLSTWLMVTLLVDVNEQARGIVADAAAAAPPPWSVGPGAALLAGAARGELDVPALRDLLLWLAATWFGFRLLGRLHPRAHERHLAAAPLPWRRRGRRWPAGVVANVRNKEWAQVAEQPGALAGFLVFAVLVFAMCDRRVLVAGVLTSPTLPIDVAHFAALATWWFLGVLLVLHGHMGRIAQWDAPQWSLWQAAPTPPGALLAGKMTAVSALLLWPLLLVGAVGALLLGPQPAVLAAYAIAALGGTGVALGLLTIVGTLPWLVRPDAQGQAMQGGRNLVGALALVVGMQLALMPALLAWRELADHALLFGLEADEAWQAAPWVLAAALAYGASWLLLGWEIGRRNFARLLQPR